MTKNTTVELLQGMLSTVSDTLPKIVEGKTPKVEIDDNSNDIKLHTKIITLNKENIINGDWIMFKSIIEKREDGMFFKNCDLTAKGHLPGIVKYTDDENYPIATFSQTGLLYSELFFDNIRQEGLAVVGQGVYLAGLDTYSVDKYKPFIENISYYNSDCMENEYNNTENNTEFISEGCYTGFRLINPKYFKNRDYAYDYIPNEIHIIFSSTNKTVIDNITLVPNTEIPTITEEDNNKGIYLVYDESTELLVLNYVRPTFVSKAMGINIYPYMKDMIVNAETLRRFTCYDYKYNLKDTEQNTLIINTSVDNVYDIYDYPYNSKPMAKVTVNNGFPIINYIDIPYGYEVYYKLENNKLFINFKRTINNSSNMISINVLYKDRFNKTDYTMDDSTEGYLDAMIENDLNGYTKIDSGLKTSNIDYKGAINELYDIIANLRNELNELKNKNN